MDRKTILIVAFFTLLALTIKAQNIEVIKFEELDKLIKEERDEYRVFNFWATWCKPCISELPYFESLNQNYKGDLTVYLISLDFVEDLETKVERFVQKKKLVSEVKLLDETDYNSFIDKISPEWSGAIPATLFVNSRNGRIKFFEGEFSKEELWEEFENFVN